jgi:hypothetical protein
MDINPYQAPQTVNTSTPVDAQSPDAPSYKLFSPRDAGLATFMGGPLGGAAIIAMNYGRLGRASERLFTCLGGGFATLLIFGLSFVLPDSFPALGLNLGITFAAWAIAKSLQQTDYDAHLSRGGRKASAWLAAGIGLLCALAMVIAIVGLVLVASLLDPSILEEL